MQSQSQSRSSIHSQKSWRSTAMVTAYFAMNIILSITTTTTLSSVQVEAFTTMPSSSFMQVQNKRQQQSEQQIQFQRQTSLLSLSMSTVDNPPSEMSDFQRRMRNLVTKPPKRKNHNIPKNLCKIETLDEYKKKIAKNEKLVVVRFYAPWCKACKAIAPAFYRLAKIYPNVEFVDVPVSPENANLHQGLGVTTLPFAHIYHPTAGLVEERKISKKRFADFAKALETYVVGQCDVVEEDDENDCERI